MAFTFTVDTDYVAVWKNGVSHRVTAEEIKAHFDETPGALETDMDRTREWVCAQFDAVLGDEALTADTWRFDFIPATGEPIAWGPV